jgi:hypothetical protein
VGWAAVDAACSIGGLAGVGLETGDPVWVGPNSAAAIFSGSTPVIFSASVVAMEVMIPIGPANRPLTSIEPPSRSASGITSPVRAR